MQILSFLLLAVVRLSNELYYLENVQNIHPVNITDCFKLNKASVNQLIATNNCNHNLANVKSLDLRDNSIDNLHADVFSLLTSVKSIDLSYNRIEYLPEKIFSNNANLKTIYLSNNQLTGDSLKAFRRLTNLKEIFLNQNKIEGIEFDVFKKSSSVLKILDLRNNLLSKSLTLESNGEPKDIFILRINADTLVEEIFLKDIKATNVNIEISRSSKLVITTTRAITINPKTNYSSTIFSTGSSGPIFPTTCPVCESKILGTIISGTEFPPQTTLDLIFISICVISIVIAIVLVILDCLARNKS